MNTQTMKRPKRQSLGAIFLVPAILAALTCVGLVSALLGDELWDGLSWLALSVPIAVVAWYAFVRRRTQAKA
jgi:membrane protein implicated in regulation of membrane protease activity